VNRRTTFLIPCLFFIAACSSSQEVIDRDGETIDSSAAPVQTKAATPTSLPPTIPVPLATESGNDVAPPPAHTAEASPTSLQPTTPIPFALESMTPGQEMAYMFQSSSGEVIHYWLYIPVNYDESRLWPLIISLHGNLGREPNLERVREQSPTSFVGSEVEFPFIVLSPYGSDPPWENYHEPMEELISRLRESLSIDSEDRFLIGLSTGAVGAWQWALALPDRFTGLALIAGPPSSPQYELDPEETCKLRDLPIWIGHSEADKLAPINSTRAAVIALENCGSTKVMFTMYTDLSHHDSFATAFRGPELYDWMLELAE